MRQRRGNKPSPSLEKARLSARAEKQVSYSAGQHSPVLIHVANPTAFDGQGSIIMLELADEACAKRVALSIARETGRRVTVLNEDMTVIQTIPAAKIH